MSFSINTNIASMQAQNYLRVNSDFQSKTINRVTSGLRIVQSGDDAAGLAVANGYRSDESVLGQGVRNANDGLSQLQIMDGGISNISQLLDRARTLATQAASGTFTGNLSVLDGEFQNVLGEINRQATSIGLNQGGAFAKNLSVFIGGGRGATNSAILNNGSVGVDLSAATVDTQSLGLTGFSYLSTAVDPETYSWFNGGSAALSFKGAGFSDTNAVAVTVNVQGVADINSLVSAINSGIQAAEQAGTAAAAAFKTANIVASADSDGVIHFTSSNSAFMVTDGGSGAAQSAGQEILAEAGGSIYGYAQGTYRNNTSNLAFVTMVANDAQKLTFSADNNGTLQKLDVTLSGATTQAQAVTQINAALQASNLSSLQSIVAVEDSGGTIGFTSTKAFNLTVGAETLSTGATDNKGLTAAAGTYIAAVPGSDTTTNASISSTANAQNAVSALATAVSTLGSAQAVVGRGQNQFGYAVNLAQSQLTNLSTAESRIRDADLASEAANLTKAQILMQAGVAALAQANSAPQAVLSLLKG
ncbi:MAG TPA: flagellin [Bryobacteraceae bacterium]|nr:flagellin [Bryobacteraceae bacterium]